MRERPILFSGAMVRANLREADPKTQTRRIMSLQPGECAEVRVERFHQTVVDRHGDEQPGPEVFGAWWDDGERGLRCPYGQPGDRLWVRESFSGPHHQERHPPRDWHSTDPIHYWADGNPEYGDWTKPRPGMFMPRWASRTLLEIYEVRVERLQDISEADCIAEGIEKTKHGFWSLYGQHSTEGTYSPRSSYRALWQSINGPESWDANPWVWAVSFTAVPSPAEEGR